MNTIGYNVFVLFPLTLIAASISVIAGIAVLRSKSAPSRFFLVGQLAILALWLSALVLVPAVGFGDWVHVFWSVQFPLLGLFITSGLWGGGGVRVQFRDEESPRELRAFKFSNWRGSAALWFYVTTGSLAVLSLVLHTYFDSGQSNPRGVTSPSHELWELARWGFGGDLPETLATNLRTYASRPMGTLPRILTVVFGPLLIGAWLWIMYSLLWMVRRLIRSQRARATFGLIAPPLITLLLFAFAKLVGSIGAFDAKAIFYIDARWGIWDADPAVMQSFGPVLLIAIVLAALVGYLDFRDSRRRSS